MLKESFLFTYQRNLLMRTLLALFTATLALAVGASADDKKTDQGESIAMLQAVVHVNFADPERQEDALGNIENILKAVPTAQVEVVCHGKGISLVVTKQSQHAEKINALMQQGAQFVACENTMKKKPSKKTALVTGVKTVPSGAIEVLRKQQKGYGYFRP
jgi:uncharacterized protein